MLVRIISMFCLVDESPTRVGVLDCSISDKHWEHGQRMVVRCRTPVQYRDQKRYFMH